MLAAEFGYSFEYVDWCLDMDDLSAHMEYRNDHPHPGSLLKAVLESFNGDKGKKSRKERTPEEQKQIEQEDLRGLISAFGNCGPKPKRKLVNYVC